ncbi:uncharacterized protein LOC126853784 [Cataglyphis hispanica]|uniref:uncharacterized protein LOC126853784 n=1 Tax=Cataglyphis hispanica TaxID=1086592 RepID=UPI002180503F|nr:uncharacterized protein LOC126853784 [Cataglyphis hispanica]
MHRRIMILLIASALVVAVHSDALKCYMCTSLSNATCGSALTTKSLQPVECTGTKIVDWQRDIQQHRILNKITGLFEIDEALRHYPGVPRDMACAKMILNVANKEVIVRTCQTAKTDLIDPCETMKAKIQKEQLVATVVVRDGTLEFDTIETDIDILHRHHVSQEPWKAVMWRRVCQHEKDRRRITEEER